ncbi:MAG: hypothetical protein ACFCVD_06375 [Nodosilinea sp.]
MNAPVASPDNPLSASPQAVTSAPIPAPIPQSSEDKAPASNDKICWIEVRHVPYTPDQQVELLHLQAEADALLLQLQAVRQKRQTGNLALVD